MSSERLPQDSKTPERTKLAAKIALFIPATMKMKNYHRLNWFDDLFLCGSYSNEILFLIKTRVRG